MIQQTRTIAGRRVRPIRMQKVPESLTADSLDNDFLDFELRPIRSSCRFDFVVLNQVLQHLSEPLETLVELRRVPKPGGQLICPCP